MNKILTSLIFCLFCINVFCCGPYWDPAYLNNQEWPYYPKMDVIFELDRLSKILCKIPKPPYKKNKKIPTLEAAKQDIKSLCKKLKMSQSETDKLLEKFQQARQQASKGKITADFTDKSEFKEFCLYLRGIAQMHKTEKALPDAWLELIKLPEKQRHYRTTWAFFMLGNIALKSNQEEARKFYERLREVRNKGFADTANLAYTSYRHEYRLASEIQNKYKYALQCYAAAAQAKDYDLISIILDDLIYLNKFELPNFSDEDLKKILQDQITREMVLFSSSIISPKLPVKLIKLIGNQKVYCAERLAWEAYYSGKYKECENFLYQLKDDSMIKLWLKARFARRKKQYAKAAMYLKKWLLLYKNSQKTPLYLREADGKHIKFSTEVRALYGTVQALQNNLLEALYSFMKAESWEDAAFIAEKMLELDMLEKFCENHKGAFKKTIQKRLEHLLARRLMRKWQYYEALKWMPKSFKETVRKYIKLSKIGNDLKYTKDERALAFYNLGKLTRHGDFLFATEFHPDCYYDYFYDLPPDLHNEYPYAYFRRNSLPFMRYHYRDKGAQLMLRAAMLAQNIKLKAAALYVGGAYLKYLYPQKADVYYKMLCDLRPFPLAEETFKKHWFTREKTPLKLSGETENDKIRDLKFFDTVFDQNKQQKEVKSDKE